MKHSEILETVEELKKKICERDGISLEKLDSERMASGIRAEKFIKGLQRYINEFGKLEPDFNAIDLSYVFTSITIKLIVDNGMPLDKFIQIVELHYYALTPAEE